LGAPKIGAILIDLDQKYKAGQMFIWDGGGEEKDSEGILVKSDGERIFK